MANRSVSGSRHNTLSFIADAVVPLRLPSHGKCAALMPLYRYITENSRNLNL
jgi:hypothetical protein